MKYQSPKSEATRVNKMKIQAAHYAHIKEKIEPILRQFSIPITMRIRWDALYAAGLSQWISDNLYSYMDDTHIDTALRNIVKEIGGTVA